MKAQQLLASLVVFAVLGTTQLNGQVQTSLVKRHQGVRAKENTDPASVTTNAKYVSVSSRLTGENARVFNGAFYESLDSIALSYSNNRGGDLNSEFLLYDNGYLWRYNPGTCTYYYSEKAMQTFDIYNDPVSQTFQQWDSASNTWQNEARFLNTFDSRQNILTNIWQVWDVSTANWRNVDNYIYTYNSDNQQLTEIYQVWNTSHNGWCNVNKYSITYDVNKNISSQLFQDWDDMAGAWVNDYMFQFTYDASNRMLTFMVQSWNTASGEWINEMQRTYGYDSYGNEVLALYKGWDNVSNNWVNYSRHLYSYDTGIIVSPKNLLVDLYQIWDSSTWVHVNKTSFTYNTNNDRLTEMHQVWLSSTSTWRNVVLFTSTYDNRHNQLSRLSQNWSIAEDDFVNSDVWTRTYNNYDQLLSYISTSWNPGGFWQPTTDDNQYNYYYEQYGTTTVNNMHSGGNISLYPSPANNFVNIDLSWNNSQPAVISVFDVVGKLYSEWEVSKSDAYHTSLSISDFPAGNYFVRIKGEKDQVIKQFVVMH